MVRFFAVLAPALLISAAAMSKKPAWVEAPVKYCSPTEVCAVGSGDTPAKAKAEARSGIMKWFKSEIKSSAEFSESSRNDSLSNSASTEAWEGTKGILEGVEIKENFDEAGEYYSLASLDKTAAAAAIKLKIAQLDDKMKTLLADDSKRSARMLEDYYKSREELNAQHLFISGATVPEVITYDQVFKNKNAKIAKNIGYYIDMRPSENSASALAIFREALIAHGNKISPNEASADRKCTGSLDAVEQHINIAGFVKYQFVLKLDCMEDGKAVGSVSATETTTGRSQKHALESALPQLKAAAQEGLYNFI